MSNIVLAERGYQTDTFGPVAADAECWRLADGVLFGVLSSLVLWSLIGAGLYGALI